MRLAKFLVVIFAVCLLTVVTDATAQTQGTTAPVRIVNYPKQGDAARCGTAQPTPYSTVACPGNTTSDQINIPAGTFADNPTYSRCVQIDNGTNKAFFIPMRTFREWDVFVRNAPANVIIRDCYAVACGSAAGQSFGTAPTADLCQAPATAGVVTDDGTNWNWNCSDGGTTVSCSTTSCKENGYQFDDDYSDFATVQVQDFRCCGGESYHPRPHSFRTCGGGIATPYCTYNAGGRPIQIKQGTSAHVGGISGIHCRVLYCCEPPSTLACRDQSYMITHCP